MKPYRVIRFLNGKKKKRLLNSLFSVYPNSAVQQFSGVQI